MQIIRGYDHISGIQFTSKQKNNNEHSKCVVELILIEQHSNRILSCTASPATLCFCLFFTLDYDMVITCYLQHAKQ